jgi:predicted ATPase
VGHLRALRGGLGAVRPGAPGAGPLGSGGGSFGRSAVLEGAEELAKLLPSMGMGSADVPSSRLLPVVDTVVQRIAIGRPTVLVIDDLQWADVSSLDVLAYLVTGFRAQNLALVVTIREEDRPVGHPLHGWLADVRRLPGVFELVLARLDPDECTEQIAGLLGRPPMDDLVADVLARSGGNAYFTELLVRDLPADAQRLPGELPTALREALLARWHSLPGPARQVTRLLAVGGRPTSFETLGAVTAGVVPAAGLPALVRQAVEAGVLQQVGEQTCWFRHPLLAEVLLGTVTSQERAPVHARLRAGLGGQRRRPPGPGRCRRLTWPSTTKVPGALTAPSRTRSVRPTTPTSCTPPAWKPRT